MVNEPLENIGKNIVVLEWACLLEMYIVAFEYGHRELVFWVNFWLCINKPDSAIAIALLHCCLQ